MKEQRKILVIDDDKNIFRILKMYLDKEGYETLGAHNGEDGLLSFSESDPDLVILDIMLPKMDGWAVCREIRKTSDVPIIMLTAKGETFDKVLGLELGADDYLSKPFDPKELTARVKAVLRRLGRSESAEQIVVFAGLTINLDNYTVLLGETELEMPPKEIELLYFLASHRNKVFTREQLLEQVWGFDFYGDSRTVDVHIKRIREKLGAEAEAWQIKTVWGVGYKFEAKA